MAAEGSMKRLAIGHRGKRDGWTTLDSHASDSDIITTVPPLPPEVTSQRWDVVEMIHVLEHFYLWEARELLTTLRSCLAKSGVLVIECPNIMFAAEVMAGVRPYPENMVVDQATMWPLYGDPNHLDPSYGHRWGYTPITLAQVLLMTGFRTVKHRPAKSHFPERDFRIEAEL